MKTEDKAALKRWEDFYRAQLKAITVDDTLSEAEKRTFLAKLEADPEAWFSFFFPNYYTCEPAPFHKAASKRIIENKRWWENRNWSRELAKSTRGMMEFLYLVLAKRELKNILLISSTEENAERLLMPFKVNLESNRRILHFYGNQAYTGNWTSYEFITRGGTSFRAVGAGQSPRGTRYENHRVDGILIDDIDTDEECRNEKRVKDKFKWLQEAVIPTVSVSGNYRILFCGNIISKNCCALYAQKLANHVDVVNIRDANGNSTWAEKNKEADIDAILSIISYASAQKEYFNNPVYEGSVFKEMAYKAIRPLQEYKFLVCYTDPSFKDTAKNDFKATVLVGRYKDEFHIIKAFVEQTTTANMIDWHYQIDAYVNNRVPVYYLMEANFIQDTLLREFYKESTKRGKIIPIKGDERKKLDKFTRIEALLEPLNRMGKLWLNAAEADNKHIQRLEEQFLALEPGSRAHDDAPDAVEGAVFQINQRAQMLTADKLTISNKKRSSKRF